MFCALCYVSILKSIEPKREAFKKRLAIHLGLAKEDPKYIQIWFWDESGFSMRVIRRKRLFEKVGMARKKG
jgi:hypothetical protein